MKYIKRPEIFLKIAATVSEIYEDFLFMFSYFQNEIKNIILTRNIELAQLVKLIKNNPQQTVIEEIRQLRLTGHDYYKSLKRTLTYFKPNCMMSKRDFKDENMTINLISSRIHLY